MSDAAVAQFIEITGANSRVASQYLQITDSNLESAMQLYFENDGAELQIPGSERPSSSGRQRSAGYEDAQGVVHLDSDDEVAGTPSGGQAAPSGGDTFDEDMEMARRMQEEMYAEGGASAAPQPDDEVRAPMARTTETLVGPASDYEYGGPDSEILRRMRGHGSGRGLFTFLSLYHRRTFADFFVFL